MINLRFWSDYLNIEIKHNNTNLKHIYLLGLVQKFSKLKPDLLIKKIVYDQISDFIESKREV